MVMMTVGLTKAGGYTEYVEDDYAIVQSPDFATLFILSRVQNVTDEKLTVSNYPGTQGGEDNKKLI